MGKGMRTRFARRSLNLQPKELIVVAVEGAVTEITYVDALCRCFQEKSERSGNRRTVCLKCKSADHQSAPIACLRLLKRMIKEDEIDDNYHAWLICDRDEWPKKQFDEIQEWIKQDPKRRHWALSSPNFEHWLALHFDDGSKVKDYFNRYDKRVKTTDFSYGQIVGACKKARRARENELSLFDCDGSDMYRFVEFLAERYGLSEDFK